MSYLDEKKIPNDHLFPSADQIIGISELMSCKSDNESATLLLHYVL